MTNEGFTFFPARETSHLWNPI